MAEEYENDTPVRKGPILGMKLRIKVSTANIEANSVRTEASTIQVHRAAKRETEILTIR